MTESESDPPAESFDDVRARAESGEAEAQASLGDMSWTGRGVSLLGHAEAVRWYRLAADQGHVSAHEHVENGAS